MTYKTKNAIFVFAFVALLMVAPLTQMTYADQEAILAAACGFEENNPPSFGSITRGATVDTIAEITATFQPKEGADGTGTVFVTAKDWKGLGDRASGVITIVDDFDVGFTDTIVVRGITYTSNNGEGTNIQFNTAVALDANAIAQSLARAINANDAAFMRASTNGDNTVEVEAETRGNGLTPAQNDYTISKTGTTTTSFSDTTLNNGGDNIQTVLQAENTKFKIGVTASSNVGQSKLANYATKTAMPEDGAAFPLEIASGTSTLENIEISFSINTAYITAADGTITGAQIGDGETLVLDGITYTGETGTPTGNQFKAGVSAGADTMALKQKIDQLDGARITTVATTNATGTFTHDGTTDIPAGAAVTINDGTTTETYTGTSGGAGAFNFDSDSATGSVDFAALSDSIIADSNIVSAVKTSATVTTLTDKSLGVTLGNAIDITTAGNGVTVSNSGDLSGGLDVLQVTFKILGTIGNTVPISETSTLTLSNIAGGKLSGGTENLQSMPYEGAIAQDLTFLIDCT